MDSVNFSDMVKLSDLAKLFLDGDLGSGPSSG
jgi:hypothetical protein